MLCLVGDRPGLVLAGLAERLFSSTRGRGWGIVGPRLPELLELAEGAEGDVAGECVL